MLVAGVFLAGADLMVRVLRLPSGGGDRSSLLFSLLRRLPGCHLT
ncbi:hypothetical protein [Actinomyces sp. 2119]|nr:hypothetical protein [Actinomyces sp. 2119]